MFWKSYNNCGLSACCKAFKKKTKKFFKLYGNGFFMDSFLTLKTKRQCHWSEPAREAFALNLVYSSLLYSFGHHQSGFCNENRHTFVCSMLWPQSATVCEIVYLCLYYCIANQIDNSDWNDLFNFLSLPFVPSLDQHYKHNCLFQTMMVFWLGQNIEPL